MRESALSGRWPQSELAEGRVAELLDLDTGRRATSTNFGDNDRLSAEVAILIDADLRNPSIPNFSSTVDGVTLSDALRSETDQIAKFKYDASAGTDRQVVERAAELAAKHGVPRTHIALAWLLQKEPVTAPSTGGSRRSWWIRPPSSRRSRS